MSKPGTQISILIALLIFFTTIVGIHWLTTPHIKPVKIMPFGDSITGLPGCWRAILWNKLKAAGYRNVTLIGSMWPTNCSQGNNGFHEGHAGFLAINIANRDQLIPWLASATPDIVLMHLGTNDIINSDTIISTDMILAAYTKLIGQMRANNPNMKIIVAQIIPVYTATSGCIDCYNRIIALNAAIPAWAAGLSTAQSPITVVDQWTGFDTATDTTDSVHPNDVGFQKMAEKWYPAVTAALDATLATTTLTLTAQP